MLPSLPLEITLFPDNSGCNVQNVTRIRGRTGAAATSAIQHIGEINGVLLVVGQGGLTSIP